MVKPGRKALAFCFVRKNTGWQDLRICTETPFLVGLLLIASPFTPNSCKFHPTFTHRPEKLCYTLIVI